MKTLSATLAFLVLLTWGTVCRAGTITDACAADDGDGMVKCAGIWDGPNQTMNIMGSQSGVPGHIGSQTLDSTAYFTANGDPTVTLHTTIDNDTGFAWTSFLVNVYMDQPFTLKLPAVSYGLTTEPGWSVANLGTYPLTATQLPASNEYIASVTFIDGTPIPDTGDPDHPGTLDFSYKLTFSGSVHYCQEMIPVPEPSMLALAFSGLVGLLVMRRKLAR